ncbi:MAG: hypothetical protein QGG40_05265 [Myxococcota bacterium]|nr:hypothetical protein [Myxococcota bacterium]
MSSRKKGFDPLASLFEPPDSPIALRVKPARPISEKDADVPSVDIEVHQELASPSGTEPVGGESRPTLAFEVSSDGPLVAVDAQPPVTAPIEDAGEEPAVEVEPVSPEPADPAPVVASPPAQAPSSPSGSAKRPSRVEELAARAVRPRSALEAARLAVAEAEAHSSRPPRSPAAGNADTSGAGLDLMMQVAKILPVWLPSIGDVRIVNALALDERRVLKALWKAHREKFSAQGEIERAVATAAVLYALDRTPAGRLVAAHVETRASDYLLWFDLQTETLVAAFADARSYFA